MTQIEKLMNLGMLGAVRQRLGAEDAFDESYDEEIETMDNEKLVELWCGWELGDGSWWTEMKYKFDKLEEN
jgi:hypothetical protein